MKQLRRIAALAAALAACLSVYAGAWSPEIVDHALYTDIVAEINGHALRSYNIGGSTAVVAEDLALYGFRVLWDAESRTLHISRAVKDGQPETPAVWPSYTAETLTQRIGTPAKPVYKTDIMTYAAGETLDAFNVNGETLVWIDDLAPFGDVVWHPEERVISLTLGDPVKLALAPLIENVEQWRLLAGAGSGYETYECKTGTLLVTRYTGTPHGGSVNMLFVRKDGERISINDLLPASPLGPGNYLDPREISIDEAGDRLSFVTFVAEAANWPGSGDVTELGDCKCTIDLLTGKLVVLEPLSEGVKNWSFTCAPSAGQIGAALVLTGACRDDGAAPESGLYPGANMSVTLSGREVRITHYAELFSEEGYDRTAYAAAYAALRDIGLPNAAENTETVNSPELREQAAKYFRFTLNGEPVAGDLRWSQGNNHVDLIFTPDSEIVLQDGDTFRLSLGA